VKCLTINSEFKEAKEAVWLLHSRFEKLDPNRIPGLAVSKFVELKEKLKIITQNYLGVPVTGKGNKKK